MQSTFVQRCLYSGGFCATDFYVIHCLHAKIPTVSTFAAAGILKGEDKYLTLSLVQSILLSPKNKWGLRSSDNYSITCFFCFIQQFQKNYM